MIAGAIPRGFIIAWVLFWPLVLTSLLVAALRVRKRCPSALPEECTFLGRHQKAIRKGADIVLIGLILVYSAAKFGIAYELRAMQAIVPESEEFRKSAIASSLAMVILWSGVTGSVIGCLSFLQSGLTRRKRIVLLVLCLLPILLTMVALLLGPTENQWRFVLLGAASSVFTWAVNGPGVLTGRSLSDLTVRILCRLRLVPRNLPG